MRYRLLPLLLGALVGPVQAGTVSILIDGPAVTVTTTPPQDNQIKRQTTRANTERGQEVPPLPPLSSEEYLAILVTNWLANQGQQADQVDAADGCAAFRQRPAGARATTIANEFGGYDPCP